MMAEASIPVDLFNPGQVFACLGFLEAADVLLGDAEGGFDWRNEEQATFTLGAGGERDPIETVLEFLAQAEPRRWAPRSTMPIRLPRKATLTWRENPRTTTAPMTPLLWARI